MRRVELSSGETRFRLAVAGLGAAAVVLMLVITRWGIGLSPDSASYLAGARGLVEGHGYSFPFGGGRWQPLYAWPPFYSMILALPISLGIEAWTAARWLNVGLYAANTILVALFIRRSVGASSWAPIAGAVLFLLGRDTLSTHGWAWSEPLSMFLGFLGLYSLDVYFGSARRATLLAAAALVGLSAYTRYTGVAFIVAGLAAILIVPGRARRSTDRPIEVAIFGGVAGLPLIGWMIRNLMSTGFPGGVPTTPQPVPLSDWQGLYRLVTLWFLPGRISEPARGVLVAAIGVILLLMTASAINAATATPPRGPARRSGVWLELLIFVPVYLALVLFARLYLRPLKLEDPRHYLPLYFALVALSVTYLAWFRPSADEASPTSRLSARRPATLLLTGLFGLAFIGTAVLHAVNTGKWAVESYSEGLGYANVSWHTGGLMSYLRGLPPTTPVLSNAFDAIYALTGRETYPFPRASEDAGTDTGLTPAEEWRQAINLVATEGAQLAAFHYPTRRGMVGVSEIGEAVAICPLQLFPEGEVYAACAED